MRAIRDLHAHRGDDQPLVEYRHADVPADDELIADPLGVWRAISEATEGHCDADRPDFTDLVGRAKHDAWAGPGTTTDAAMRDYVELVESLK